MNKHIEQLIKLSTENPNMEIIVMVDAEVVPGDDYCSWFGRITSVIVDWTYVSDEITWIGLSDIYEQIETLCGEDILEEVTDEKINAEIDSLKEMGGIKEKIIIQIGV